jgi:hypothetical protein
MKTAIEIEFSKYQSRYRQLFGESEENHEFHQFTPSEWRFLSTDGESKVFSPFSPVVTPAPTTKPVPPVPLRPASTPECEPEEEPLTEKVSPLIVGDLERARRVIVFERDSDARSVAEKIKADGHALIGTGGATDGKFLRPAPEQSELWLWPQSLSSDSHWLEDITVSLGRPSQVVAQELHSALRGDGLEAREGAQAADGRKEPSQKQMAPASSDSSRPEHKKKKVNPSYVVPPDEFVSAAPNASGFRPEEYFVPQALQPPGPASQEAPVQDHPSKKNDHRGGGRHDTDRDEVALDPASSAQQDKNDVRESASVGTSQEPKASVLEFPIREKIASSFSTQKKIQYLVDAFGLPLHRNQQDAPSRLNERFWAEFLAIEHILIFEHDERQFYLYHPPNGRFESLTAQVLKAHLSDLLREADLKWDGCYGITTLDTEKARSSIVELTRGIVEKRDFFVNRPWAIHCQNTMLVIEEGQIKPKPFSPHFRSRNQLSVAYEPKAMCPRFQKELLEPAVCQEDIELIQKMFGLMVLGINRPQRIFILQGAPNTGKTTLGRLVTTLIGRWNYSELRTQHLNERFETSRALGKTLLFGPDVKAHFLQSEGAHKLKSKLAATQWTPNVRTATRVSRFQASSMY